MYLITQEDTAATLQLWTQIVGKIRLTQTPWLAHSIASDLVKDATAALLAE